MANAYTDPIIEDIPTEDCGPAMKKLTQRQRKFVMAWRDLGGGRNKAAQAARIAGYSNGMAPSSNGCAVAAYKLTHDFKVIEAMAEEARGALASASIMITEKLLNFAEHEPDAKLRLKALGMVADRAGFHVVQEHKVTTTDISKTDDVVIARLRQLIENDPTRLALLPKELQLRIEHKPAVETELVVDAEFAEVDPDADLLGE